MRKIVWAASLAAVSLILALSRFWAEKNYLLVGIVMIFLTILPMLIRIERKNLREEELVILAVMIAIASISRVPFAGWASVQPKSFVVLISGAAFGAEAGFFIGSMSAFVSNLFLGQGPWTPWQMFAWGLMGLSAGILRHTALIKNRYLRIIYGFLWGIVFGWIVNMWFVLSVGQAITVKTLFAAMLSSITMDVMHAACNAVFLGLFGETWLRILARHQSKFGLFGLRKI